jgi:peroxiredoxin
MASPGASGLRRSEGAPCWPCRVTGALLASGERATPERGGRQVRRMSDGLRQQQGSGAPARAPASAWRDRRPSAPVLCLVAAIALGGGDAAVLRARAVSSPAVAVVGSRAPDFDLPVLGHPSRRVSLSGLRGHPVVVVFNCGCKACNDFDRGLAAAGLPEAEVVAVTANPSAYEGRRLSRFRRQTGFRWPVLADGRMETTLRYGSGDCPRVWLIDGDGVIRYTGAGPGQPARAAVEGLVAALGRI